MHGMINSVAAGFDFSLFDQYNSCTFVSHKLSMWYDVAMMQRKLSPEMDQNDLCVQSRSFMRIPC